MKTNDYWIKFWKDSSKQTMNKDSQSQVLRTTNKVPITEKEWENILQFVFSHLNLDKEDHVLDLFGGNGLFAEAMAQKCKGVTVVDVSKELLDNINTTKYKNITLIEKDVRKLSLPKNSYSKVLIYAGIQYLSKKEVVNLFDSIFYSLKKGGVCYIGDIPDENRMWDFFNNKEREASYFESLKKDQPIIGTWFDNIWLEKLADNSGFSEAITLQQKTELLYSHFRYDLILIK